MVGSVLIGIAATVALLKLFDIFLSEAQKDAISLRLSRVWNTLDDLARLPRGLLLKNATLVGIVSLSITLSMVVYFAYWSEGNPIIGFCVGLFITVPGTFITLLLGEAMSRNPLSGRKLLINTLVAAGIGMTYLIVYIAGMFVLLDVLALVIPVDKFKTRGQFLPLWWAVELMGIWAAAAALAGAVIVIATLYSVYFGRAVLGLIELVVRRIIEHEKGPILAFSGVLGGVGTLIKLFINGTL